MTLTKRQRALIEKHARAYDVRAKAIKTLQRLHAKPDSSVLRLHRDVVSCDFDRSLTHRIHGTVSTPAILDDNCSFLSRGAILKVPIPLLWEHDRAGGPIGRVYHMFKSPMQVTISAVLFDNSAGNFAWEMFQRDETLTGLSAGYDDLHLLAKIDGIKFFSRFAITEVSVTRCPKNPDCYFHRYVNDKRIGLQKKETKDQEEIEQCIIDLMDSGEVDDEDDARAICEEIYDDD